VSASQVAEAQAPAGSGVPAGVRLRRLRAFAPRAALGSAVALIYLFLYLPAVIIAVFSFNKSSIMSWPPTGFTLDWYRAAFANPDLTTGLKNSGIVAVISVGIALLLGVPGGFGLDRYSFPGKRIFARLLVLPFLMLGVIGGIALLTFFLDVSAQLSLKTVIVAHTTMLVAVFVIQMAVGLARWDRTLELAASDLGASELKTFFLVVLPNFRSTIIGACLLGVTVSLDEVARTFFVTGTENTLPMVIWSSLHHEITPAINAMGTLILGVSLIAILIWSRLVAGRRIRT
jgi:spermidine/putrescine transport system permease protein